MTSLRDHRRAKWALRRDWEALRADVAEALRRRRAEWRIAEAIMHEEWDRYAILVLKEAQRRRGGQVRD